MSDAPGNRVPLRIRMIHGHPVPLHPDECEPHTPRPDSYPEWLEWARRMDATHNQRQCRGCGLHVVWEPKPDAATTQNTPPEGNRS